MRIPGLMQVFGEHERGAIFRLGLFHGVVGPGRAFFIPIVDRVIVVDLNEAIPEWKGLSTEAISRYVEFLVQEYCAMPVGLSVRWLQEEMREERKEARERTFREAEALAKDGDGEAAVELLCSALRVDRDTAQRNVEILSMDVDDSSSG